MNFSHIVELTLLWASPSYINLVLKQQKLSKGKVCFNFFGPLDVPHLLTLKRKLHIPARREAAATDRGS